MREFKDHDGRVWVSDVRETLGPDYKGRYYLVIVPGAGGDPVSLEDVRWNSERSARRTLESMSVWELNRRLRSALGRASAPSGQVDPIL
jgi:hypothetical protein